MTIPNYLLAKTRTEAVHYLVSTETESPLFGKVSMLTTSCGQPLSAAQWQDRGTQVSSRVTCRECWVRCHPAAKGMF